MLSPIVFTPILLQLKITYTSLELTYWEFFGKHVIFRENDFAPAEVRCVGQ